MTDPLLTALTAALAPHGVTDPAAITAAANAAVAVLGRDRCVCRASVHAEHHATAVDGCPWCAKAAETVATPAASPAVGGMDTVPTGGLL